MTSFIARLCLVSALIGFAGPLAAHVDIGPNGGIIQDLGDHHVELVVNADKLSIYFSDGKTKPIDATGFKAVATVLGKGKKAKVTLIYEGSNVMSAAGDFAVEGLKVIVSLTAPNGKSKKGIFKLAANTPNTLHSTSRTVTWITV